MKDIISFNYTLIERIRRLYILKKNYFNICIAKPFIQGDFKYCSGYDVCLPQLINCKILFFFASLSAERPHCCQRPVYVTLRVFEIQKLSRMTKRCFLKPNYEFTLHAQWHIHFVGGYVAFSSL